MQDFLQMGGIMDSSISVKDQLEYKAALAKACRKSADYAEGVSAFLQKRPSKFIGC